MINNLAEFTNFSKVEQLCTLAPNSNKLHEVFFTSEEDLSHISQYGKSYHNSESSAKCPRCENLGELVEDGPVRCLYRCRDCGIFAKLTKKKRLDGLRRAIAQGELTTALEILEVAGHEGTDAIAALNRPPAKIGTDYVK